MVITAGIFVFAPLVMAWPVMAAGIGFTDAFFETISAVTTTGLSTLATLEGKPETFVFSRAWMQWVGGLGIVVLSVAAMIRPGLAAKRLDLTEDYENDLVGSTRTNARRSFAIYALLTLAGVLMLVGSGAQWYDALLFSMAAVSTGGFAPRDGSLLSLGSGYSQAIVILVSMAGGVSLALYQRTYREGWKSLWQDRQLQAFLLAGAAASLMMAFFLWFQDGLVWTNALRHGALNALSAQSTAGFASMDISAVGPGSKLTLILSMAIGGSIGSTAGGIKIFRLLVVWRLLHLIMQRAGAPPDAVAQARLGGRRLESDEIQGVAVVITAFVGCVVLSWLPFVALGHAPLDSLFEVVSALGTAGISAGIAGPDLHPLLKAVLGVDMLLGRLELIAWLVCFFPGTWVGLRRKR
jgi:trk system potassium uptake protein TrkH